MTNIVGRTTEGKAGSSFSETLRRSNTSLAVTNRGCLYLKWPVNNLLLFYLAGGEKHLWSSIPKMLNRAEYKQSNLEFRKQLTYYICRIFFLNYIFYSLHSLSVWKRKCRMIENNILLKRLYTWPPATLHLSILANSQILLKDFLKNASLWDWEAAADYPIYSNWVRTENQLWQRAWRQLSPLMSGYLRTDPGFTSQRSHLNIRVAYKWIYAT